eukprot:4704009-Pyramimonas_sp.AAC.1
MTALASRLGFRRRPSAAGGGVAVLVADRQHVPAAAVLHRVPPVPVELPRRGGRRPGGPGL